MTPELTAGGMLMKLTQTNPYRRYASMVAGRGKCRTSAR